MYFLIRFVFTLSSFAFEQTRENRKRDREDLFDACRVIYFLCIDFVLLGLLFEILPTKCVWHHDHDDRGKNYVSL